VLAVKDVTCILSAIERGDAQAGEQLLPLVYDELLYHNCLQTLELRSRLAPWRAARNRGVVSRARFFFIFSGGL
jgi:hypothetical protein